MLKALRNNDLMLRIPAANLRGAERELAEDINDIINDLRKKLLKQESHTGRLVVTIQRLMLPPNLIIPLVYLLFPCRTMDLELARKPKNVYSYRFTQLSQMVPG